MGIDFAQVRFFDECARLSGIDGPMLALGSLNIQETPDTISAYGREHSYAKLTVDRSVASFFKERYGIESYVSCDVNGLADEYIDLSVPLPRQFVNSFRSILNGGTLEHIFDLRQAMENIHDATMPSGLMIHTCPVTWFDHGFVNHNPVLFHLTARANEYEVVAEGYYYNLNSFPGQTKPIVSLIGVDEEIPGFNKKNTDMFSGSTLPANCMHLIALRKTRDAKFAIPTQVAY